MLNKEPGMKISGFFMLVIVQRNGFSELLK